MVIAAVLTADTHDISRIIRRVVNVLHHHFGGAPEWPSDDVFERERDKWAASLPPELAGAACVVDGSEFRIPRPSDPAEETKVYSGKKKQHSANVLFICTLDGKLLWWSMHQQGSANDQPLWNSLGLREHFEGKEYGLLGDGGFFFNRVGDAVVIIGYKPARRRNSRSARRTADGGSGLTEAEKASNKQLSSRRVVVENAIGAVKVFRAFTSVFRHYSTAKDNTIDFDMVIDVACHVTNLRLDKHPLRRSSAE